MLNLGAVVAGASVSGAAVLILSIFMIVVVVKRGQFLTIKLVYESFL